MFAEAWSEILPEESWGGEMAAMMDFIAMG